MDVEYKTLSLNQAASVQADALVIAIPDAMPDAAALAHGRAADSAGAKLAGWLQRVLESGDLEDGAGKCLFSHGGACEAKRVVLVRVGDGSAASVRKGVLSAMAGLRQPAVKHVVLCNLWGEWAAGAWQAAVVAAAEATYVYTTTLSKPKPRNLNRLVLAGTATASAAVQEGIRQGVALVEGIELAKEWANRPSNHATPTHLARAAEKLGKFDRVKVEVLGPKEVAKLGMGAFMAVAQGAEEPLRFIVVHYSGGPKGQAPVVLVGKGVTFDTGGISLKPAPEMEEMKFDMGGAASVLGTLRTIAELQPAINVVAIIPACENMPDGRAIKPGDVVTSMSGQTIEILNTDAEGRLILCDALTYAERFKPACIIDIATLTGACVIALGHVRTGMFTDSDELAQALTQAGQAALDPCWRMPLDDEYGEGLKSNFADMANVAGRAGGSVSAAKFLQKFTQSMRWAHLDIAGSAWKSGAAKGATGRPVGLLVSFLLAQVVAQPADQPARKPKATRKAG